MRRLALHLGLTRRSGAAALPAIAAACTLAIAGCGGSSGGATVSVPTVGAAKVFSLGGFAPAGHDPRRQAGDGVVHREACPTASR